MLLVLQLWINQHKSINFHAFMKQKYFCICFFFVLSSSGLYSSPRAWGSGRTSFTSGSALGLWTSTVTNCCLEPGEDVGEALDMGTGLRGKEGGREGAGSGGGGGGEGDGGAGLVPLLGDWTLGKGPMLCWVTVDNWGGVMCSFLEGTEASFFLMAM